MARSRGCASSTPTTARSRPGRRARTGCSRSTRATSTSRRRSRASAVSRAGRREVRPGGHRARARPRRIDCARRRRRPRSRAAAPRDAGHAVVRRAHGTAVRPRRGRSHVPLLHGPAPGFVDGKPGFWWSINGHLWPDVPMYLVDEGDIVVFEIENHSGEVHPMHLHGHHAVVLSRDGEPASGSPWWVDSLDVENGETMTSRLRAPTTPASGWTTATTSSTPRRGWSPT